MADAAVQACAGGALVDVAVQTQLEARMGPRIAAVQAGAGSGARWASHDHDTFYFSFDNYLELMERGDI